MKKYFTLMLSCLFASLKLVAQCPATTAQMDLQINNVRARILNGGDLWWDPLTQANYYTVPITGTNNAIYAGGVWFGGMDAGGQVYTAAQTYRQNGANDFWAGPISKNPGTGALSVTPATCNAYDRFYHISRADVQFFLNTGISTPDIQAWPGNGNVAAGEMLNLAPYFDANNDGIYTASSGDYPYFNFSNTYPTGPGGQQICDDYLFGDDVIWWVFNDIGNVKTGTNSAPIGLEIRAMAYAYSQPGNVLDNTTFYRYQIINRSSTTYFDFHTGMWVDPDLGNAADDYVGCDVGRSLGYAYNGDADDDGGYGLFPPAIGVDLLRGPLADAGDLIDNDGDGSVDEPGEQCLMGTFLYYENSNSIPTGNPSGNVGYYNYLRGIWLDNFPVTYGGDGRGNGPGATSTPTTYMFPDNTNPAFTTPWTMSSGGLPVGDMRFINATGSFTMQPGEVNYCAYGVVYARSNTPSTMPSVIELQNASDIVQAFFDNCFTTTALPDLDLISDLNIGPNPFVQSVSLNASGLSAGEYTLKVYDSGAHLVETIQFNGRSSVINVGKNWSKGVYYLMLEGEKYHGSGKVVKW